MNPRPPRSTRTYTPFPYTTLCRSRDLPDRLDAPFGIGESAVLFEEGRTRQEHMRVIGGLVEEQVMDDHELHRRQPLRNMMRVGIGLENILALDVDRAECAVDCGIEHVGDAQPDRTSKRLNSRH